MSARLPIVTIVGRTNVGKSTLFNALHGQREAIVLDQPGVTRDRNYAVVEHRGVRFQLVDTGGLIGEEEHALGRAVRAQTEVALGQADLVVAVLDGLNGVHPQDSDLVARLRLADRPVLWVVNKCEKPGTEILAADFFRLGIDGLHYVSAAHRTGLRELLGAITTTIKCRPVAESETAAHEAPAIRVAVLGKPNVGKSSLVNRIVGEERVITSPIAGTTRDPVDISLTRDGQRYVVVDTAGLRKKSRVEDLSVERLSNIRTMRVLADSDVAILVIDATEGAPVEQDMKVAGLVHDRGKGLIIVVNKWDAVEKDHRTVKEFERLVQSTLKFARYAPILFVSALSGKRCPSILQMVAKVHQEAQTRVATSELNRILTRAFERKPPPVYRGDPVKLFFATQTEVSPPTIVVFVNHPARLNFAYHRYIRNCLRKEFPFTGSDIKLVVRKRTEKAQRAENVRA